MMSNNNDLFINAIVLPTDIFFEGSQIHQIFSSDEGTPDIRMSSSKGFYYREAGHYNEQGEFDDTDIILSVSPDGVFKPFGLSATERLYVPAGSTLTFEWLEAPTIATVKTITLVANKKVEPELDTAVVKLSGWFLIHDSAKGWVRNSTLSGGAEALRVVLKLSQFALYSNGALFDDAFLSNFFYEDFSAVATGLTGSYFESGTVTIKNMSNVPRVLTLVPYNSGLSFISSIDENPNDLPPNVEIRNGALVLNLAANQDS